MPAAQTQKAPAPRREEPGKTVKTAEKPSFKEKLYSIKPAAGAAVMVLLLILSLFVGNFRALQNASPKDFLRQGDVKSIVEDRIAEAGNAVTVAKRAGVDPLYIEAVETAADDMGKAKTAREISRADQKLTVAVSGMVEAADEKLDDNEMLMAAADGFAEQGSFLRQEAKKFNKKALKADKLYNGLPTKFMLSEPDVYEGL